MKIQLIQKVIITVFFIMLTSVSLRAEPFKVYKPTWEIGQKWTVEVAKKTPQPKLGMRNPPPFVAQWGILTFRFVVEKIVEIEGDPCWCIRIDFLRNDKKHPSYRLYYSVSRSALKRLEVFNDKGEKIVTGESYSGDSAVVGEWVRSLPLEFPFFLADAEKHSPQPFIRKDGTKRYKSYEAYQTCRIIEKNVRGEKKKIFSVYVKERDEVKEQEGLAALQLWEKGMPWWSEATETENGIFRCKARLISIGGKKLENPRPWNLGPANAPEEGKKDDD